MNYTPEEIIDYVAEEDVKFIRLAFCDINGIQKNVAITPSELISALKYGVCVNADGIDGFHGDIVLKPDASTLAELPWRPQHGRVVHFFCDVFDADGAPVVSDPRYMLKSSGKTAEAFEAQRDGRADRRTSRRGGLSRHRPRRQGRKRPPRDLPDP